MGWLKLGARTEPRPSETFSENLKYTTQHIESIAICPETSSRYPLVPLSTLDSQLLFIPAEEISERTSAEKGGLLIVVDDIVYDCTDFINEHPGGRHIIQSFAGAECSWQFWRFHGKGEMEKFGRGLRVGRTKGLVNRYKEPQRYVGLRRLGDDNW